MFPWSVVSTCWRCLIKISILLVESDDELAARAVSALESAGHEVIRASTILDGMKKMYEKSPELIIMRKEPSAASGEDDYLRMRQVSYRPIIVVGDQGEAAEMLELGADAYVNTPLNMDELVARVRSLLRRRSKTDPPGNGPQPEIKDFINREEGKGARNHLTPTEFRLASCLIMNRGKVMAYPQIIGEVWGGKKISTDDLHFYVRRLRVKAEGMDIHGLRGTGYYLPDDGHGAPEAI